MKACRPIDSRMDVILKLSSIETCHLTVCSSSQQLQNKMTRKYQMWRASKFTVAVSTSEEVKDRFKVLTSLPYQMHWDLQRPKEICSPWSTNKWRKSKARSKGVMMTYSMSVPIVSLKSKSQSLVLKLRIAFKASVTLQGTLTMASRTANSEESSYLKASRITHPEVSRKLWPHPKR